MKKFLFEIGNSWKCGGGETRVVGSKKRKGPRGLSKLLLTAVDGSGNNNCNAMRTGANTIEPCTCGPSSIANEWRFDVLVAVEIVSMRVSVFCSLLSARRALASRSR